LFKGHFFAPFGFWLSCEPITFAVILNGIKFDRKVFSFYTVYPSNMLDFEDNRRLFRYSFIAGSRVVASG
jgi:hypothetical protein